METGFIGLGAMGKYMAINLSKAGYLKTVFNRTTKKTEIFKKEYKCLVSNSPSELATRCRLIIISVSRDQDVLDIVKQLITKISSNSIIVDTSTTSSKTAKKATDLLKKVNSYFLDAPVSGGQAGAENGALTVMIGGDQESFDKAKNVIDSYSKKVQLLGPSGSGQLAKMVNQICIAGLVQGLSEAINFGLNAGLKMENVIEVISKGAAQSWQMENRYKTMIDDKFDFGFAVDWMRKDLKIAMDEAKKNNSPLPITKIIDEYYAEVQKMGGQRWDTSSLIKRFRK